MNKSKLILSYLRDGDFAHPGEIEAIKMAMKPIEKNSKDLLLDVGCGLGGTAHYLQSHGWGKVIGLDIDEHVIQHAKKHYPDSEFYRADIMDVNTLFPDKKFDVIYFFSSFFCFPYQQQTLTKLMEAANKDCQLIIFDYSQLNDEVISNPFNWSKTVNNFYPIHLEQLKKTLLASGWNFKDSLDISHCFETWYQQLLEKFETKRDVIIDRFGSDIFDSMYKGYEKLLHNIHYHQIGGIIVYGVRS